MRWIARILVFTAALTLGAAAASLFTALTHSGLSDCVITFPPKSSQSPKGVHIFYAGWWPESDARVATMRFIVHNGNDIPVIYRAYTATDANLEVRIDGEKYHQMRCQFGIQDFQIAPGASAEILTTRWDFPRNLDENAQATVGLYFNLSPNHNRPITPKNPDILATTEPFPIPTEFRTARLP